MQEYRDHAGVDEGMDGISTRFAFKTLSATYNHDTQEVAADPVHLMYVLEQAIRREQFPDDVENTYIEFIKADLGPRYAEFIGNEIQKAYLESYHDYGQNLFDRYVAYADAWIEDQDFKDSDTGQLMNRELLNQELVENREACGNCESERLPQRGRKVYTEGSGSARRQKSVMDELREDPGGHRAAHVQSGGGPPARHQLRLEKGQRNGEEAQRICRADGDPRLHREAGPQTCRVVHAGKAGWLTNRAHYRSASRRERQEFRQSAAVHPKGQGACPARGPRGVEKPQDHGCRAGRGDHRPRGWRA